MSWIAAAVVALSLTGCGIPPAEILKTAADVGRVVGRVFSFLRDNGSPVERVERAAEQLKAGNTAAAFGETAVLLEQLRQAGVKIPDEVSRDFTAGMAAAYAIEQGMRGLHGRSHDGSPKEGGDE
jgi:hypothetical protein